MDYHLGTVSTNGSKGTRRSLHCILLVVGESPPGGAEAHEQIRVVRALEGFGAGVGTDRALVHHELSLFG